MKALILAVTILAGSALHAEELPESPRVQGITPTFKTLYLADFATRTGDLITTYRFLNFKCQCAKEIDPLAPHGKALLPIVAFQYGVSAGLIYGSEKLRHHHHSRIALILVAADIGMETWTIQNNLRLPQTVAHINTHATLTRYIAKGK